MEDVNRTSMAKDHTTKSSRKKSEKLPMRSSVDTLSSQMKHKDNHKSLHCSSSEFRAKQQSDRALPDPSSRQEHHKSSHCDPPSAHASREHKEKKKQQEAPTQEVPPQEVPQDGRGQMKTSRHSKNLQDSLSQDELNNLAGNTLDSNMTCYSSDCSVGTITTTAECALSLGHL